MKKAAKIFTILWIVVLLCGFIVGAIEKRKEDKQKGKENLPVKALIFACFLSIERFLLKLREKFWSRQLCGHRL